MLVFNTFCTFSYFFALFRIFWTFSHIFVRFSTFLHSFVHLLHLKLNFAFYRLQRVPLGSFCDFLEKWLTPLFTGDKEPGVETEFEVGLSCIECLPACDETKFTVSTTRLPLRRLSLQVMTNSSRLWVWIYCPTNGELSSIGGSVGLVYEPNIILIRLFISICSDFWLILKRSNVRNMNEMLLLKVFYGKPEHFMYRQYIAKTWFELLCKCF